MAELTKTRMTATEFLQLPETNQMVELIKGEIVVTSVKDIHQAILIAMLLFLKTTFKTGTWRIAPMDVHLDDENVLEPDIFWVSEDSTRCVVGSDGFWHGAPDFVVEILSNSTKRRDREVKFNLYERHGVREYWMVEPEAAFLEVYTLREGKYVRLGFFGLGETFKSPVLGDADIPVDALLKP
jgi:Uma2 family endonuclease